MISLVAAIDLNRGLGNDNDLLVKLPNDMKHFKELTTGQFCVFGRKTYESIGKPLPNRKNIVITRDVNYEAKGAFVYNSLEDVIFQYQSHNGNDNEMFICGGSEIYQQSLPYADRLYLTIINHEFPRVDTFFPIFSMTDWKPIGAVANKSDENNLFDHHFVTYEKRFNKK